MNARPVQLFGRVALLLVFAYGFLALLWNVGGLTGLALIGIAATLPPLLGQLLQRERGVLWLIPGGTLVVGVLLALPVGFASDSVGMALVGGVLIGTPLVVAAAVMGVRTGSPYLLPMTLLGLVGLWTTFAAQTGATAAGAGPLAAAFEGATRAQVGGIGSLLQGAPSAGLPLQALNEPLLALLGLVAIVAALLEFVDPSAGSREDGGQPSGPSAVLGPVACAVITAASFELVAAAAPRFALLALAAGVVTVTALLLVLPRVTRGIAKFAPAAPV